MTRLRQLKMKVYGEGLKIRFKPNEAQLQEAFEFGFGFGASVEAGKILEDVKPTAVPVKRQWKCLVCGHIAEGDAPPASCPVCGVGPEQFVEITAPAAGFQSDREEAFLIIGNGAAGNSSM